MKTRRMHPATWSVLSVPIGTLFFLALPHGWGPRAHAPEGEQAVAGTVSDWETEAPIENVQVSVPGDEGTASRGESSGLVRTDEFGRYRSPAPGPGPFRLRYRDPLGRRHVKSPAPLEVSLELGDVLEWTVPQEGDCPGNVVMIDAQTVGRIRSGVLDLAQTIVQRVESREASADDRVRRYGRSWEDVSLLGFPNAEKPALARRIQEGNPDLVPRVEVIRSYARLPAESVRDLAELDFLRPEAGAWFGGLSERELAILRRIPDPVVLRDVLRARAAWTDREAAPAFVRSVSEFQELAFAGQQMRDLRSLVGSETRWLELGIR